MKAWNHRIQVDLIEILCTKNAMVDEKLCIYAFLHFDETMRLR